MVCSRSVTKFHPLPTNDISSRVITIQQQRGPCAARVAYLSARGPELSQSHREQIVASTLLTFTSLYKLAIYVRGDYDTQVNDGNPETPELTQIYTELSRVAEQGALVGTNGLNAMSMITQATMECRGTEIAALIKSVKSGRTEAQNKIDEAKNQKSIFQDRLGAARSSLQDARDTLSGTKQQLQEAKMECDDFRTGKKISWIVPAFGLFVHVLDKLAGIEKDLRDSVDRLHNTIDYQSSLVATCQNELSNTESRIAAATATVNDYSHVLTDLDRLQDKCDELLKQSRATEAQLVKLQITMRKLYSAVQNILGKSKGVYYFTEKVELVGLILDVLDEGYIDNALKPKAELIINDLKDGDTTGLFNTRALQEKVKSLRKKGVSV